MPFGAGQLFQGNQSLEKAMGVRRRPWHRLIVHQPPKKDPATRADGSMGLMGGLQLLLQFFDAGFQFRPPEKITNRLYAVAESPVVSRRRPFPQIAAGSKFSYLASSIPFVVHHCTSTRKPLRGGTRFRREV